MPASTVDDDPDATAWSTARVRDQIAEIAAEPHPMGSDAIARVRNHIVDELADVRVGTELQATTAPNWYGASPATVDVVNVLARIPGTAPTGTVAIVGHYDTVPTTPGANDNSSSIAIMLEIARAITAGDRLRNDIVLVFTDGEEPSERFGSTAFVEGHRWGSDIDVVVNLEAIGSGGASLLVEMHGPETWMIDRYVDAVPYPAAFAFITDVTALIGGSNSDFATFRDAGVPGIELAYLRGSSIYHTPSDAPDRLSDRTLHQHGTNALALLRHLGDSDLDADRDASGRVFLTIGRGTVVRYPTWVGAGLLVAGGGALVLAMRRTSAAGSPAATHVG